jgi:hypothetical protein
LVLSGQVRVAFIQHSAFEKQATGKAVADGIQPGGQYPGFQPHLCQAASGWNDDKEQAEVPWWSEKNWACERRGQCGKRKCRFLLIAAPLPVLVAVFRKKLFFRKPDNVPDCSRYEDA